MEKTGLRVGMMEYISLLHKEGRYATAKSYQDAWNSFARFSQTTEIPYKEITKERLHQYETYLTRRGCMRNTISTYMRRLRCIYNRAVEQGEANYVANLFSGVFTGVESLRKRSLPIKDLHQLMTFPVKETTLKKTQLAVCLMFQYGGMPFVDFAHLKAENIQNNVLTYRRQKTGTLIRLELLKGAKQMQHQLSYSTPRSSPYLMPFLSGRKEGIAAYQEYKEALQQFNRNLKILKKRACIKGDVTSYSIRHSFANLLKEQNVPIEMISELLGHQSIRTTHIYLRSFSLDKLKKVTNDCFRKVYGYKEK